jgi:hypothetical protein
MELLKGLKVKDLGFSPKKMGDLLYYEGTLLAHFINAKNEHEHYFYKWSDCNDTYNRWLIFKISEENLQLFFDQQMNLLQLIQTNSFVFFTDINDKLQQKQTIIVAFDKIPATYFPSIDSFFEENEYEKYASVLKNRIDSHVSAPNISIHEMLLSEIAALKAQQKENYALLKALALKVSPSALN